MNSRWHLYISLIKSIIRILACIIAVVCKSFKFLAIGFGLAEGLGVLEEVRDER